MSYAEERIKYIQDTAQSWWDHVGTTNANVQLHLTHAEVMIVLEGLKAGRVKAVEDFSYTELVDFGVKVSRVTDHLGLATGEVEDLANEYADQKLKETR